MVTTTITVNEPDGNYKVGKHRFENLYQPNKAQEHDDGVCKWIGTVVQAGNGLNRNLIALEIIICIILIFCTYLTMWTIETLLNFNFKSQLCPSSTESIE